MFAFAMGLLLYKEIPKHPIASAIPPFMPFKAPQEFYVFFKINPFPEADILQHRFYVFPIVAYPRRLMGIRTKVTSTPKWCALSKIEADGYHPPLSLVLPEVLISIATLDAAITCKVSSMASSAGMSEKAGKFPSWRQYDLKSETCRFGQIAG